MPSTDSGYGGQRVVLMDADGNYDISDTINDNWEGGSFGAVTDYDHDGSSELFLATAYLYDGRFVVLNLDDYSTVWSLGAGKYEDNVSVVKAADINRDGSDDAIIVNSTKIEHVDIKNEVRLSSVLEATEVIQDVSAGDIDGDGDVDIAVATSSKVQVWLQNNGKFVLSNSFETQCTQIELLEIDSDIVKELVCLGSSSYYATTAVITAFNYARSSISVLKTLELHDAVSEITTDPDDAGALFVAAVKEGGSYYDSQSYILNLSMKTWFWVKTQYSNDSVISPSNPEAFSLVFAEDGRLQVTTDCNGMRGDYKVEAHTIQFEQMMSTRKFCQDSQELMFAKMLEEVTSFLFTSKGQLVLLFKYDSGTMLFQ